MNRKETIKWLESLKAEIGKSEHSELWHYAEAIDITIKALTPQEQCLQCKWYWGDNYERKGGEDK